MFHKVLPLHQLVKNKLHFPKIHEVDEVKQKKGHFFLQLNICQKGLVNYHSQFYFMRKTISSIKKGAASG